MRAGAGRDDQRVAGVVAAVALQPERALAKVGGVDMVEDDLGLEALGMRLHALHQVGSHQAVGVAWPVVDLGRGHQLAALLQAGDHHRLEVGARGIDGGGVAGGTGAEDQQAGVLGCAHGRVALGNGTVGGDAGSNWNLGVAMPANQGAKSPRACASGDVGMGRRGPFTV